MSEVYKGREESCNNSWKGERGDLSLFKNYFPLQCCSPHFYRPGSFFCVFWGISLGSYNRLHEDCQKEAILNWRSLSFMEVNSARRHFLSSHFVLEPYLRKWSQESSIVPEGASPKLKQKRAFQNLVSLSFLWAESDLIHRVKTWSVHSLGLLLKGTHTQRHTQRIT